MAAHSFRMDAASAANCTHRNTTGLPTTAAAWAFALSFKISTFPGSAKFLDVFGYRVGATSSAMSAGFEANNAGDFYYNREQGSPFTNITYTETIISTGGSTAFRRMFGTFGTNSQQVWTRAGGTSTQVINLTEALGFTILRGLFAADEQFPSDMGGVVDFDQVALSSASQTQGNLETQSDNRSASLSSMIFYNDCTGATSFVTDGGGAGNNWTQTGATSDVVSDSWTGTAVTGTGSNALSPFALAATGTETFTGAASLALQPFGLAASGTESMTGTASLAMQPFGMLGSSTQTATGTGTGALQPFGMSGTGTVGALGSGSLAMSPLGMTSAGTEVITGSASLAMQPFRETGSSSRFPLTVAANNRYLVDNQGRPFPIKGRAAWGVLTGTSSERDAFITNSVTRKFNTAEFRLINSDGSGSTRAPFANDGALLPFTKKLDGSAWTGSMSYSNINNDAPDFTFPDLTYWAFADAALDAFHAAGFLTLVFPSYVGFKGTTQGWMAEMEANGAAKMFAYGAFIANRYKSYPNIVWMLGGDSGTTADTFTAGQIVVEQALIDGLLSISGQLSTICSAEWNSPSIMSDQTDVDFSGFSHHLSGAYVFDGAVITQARRASTDDTGPSFLLEEPYDQEGSDGTNVNADASQPVRRYIWWGGLNALGWYVAGNGYVWPFNLPGTANDWDDHLDTQGAIDLTVLNTFIDSIEWWLLKPSGIWGMRTLVTSGAGTGTGHGTTTAVASACSGALLIVYVPPDHTGTITVDPRDLAADYRARWLDPTAGIYSDAGTSGAYSGDHTASSVVFTPPGNNAEGTFDDWVLVLDTQATGSGSLAISPFGMTGSGSVLVTGTSTLAMSPLGNAATATESIPGSGTLAMSPFGESGSGTETVTGTASLAIPSFRISGTDGTSTTNPLVRVEGVRRYRHPRS